MLRKAVSDQRTERSARKLDREAVLVLSRRGLSTGEIAKHQGVAASTIWRFLHRMKPEQAAIKEFKRGRADVLARLQIKSLDAQERLLDSLDDAVLAALTPHQKATLLHSLNAQAGTLYDKERLETGKSTANVSSLSEIMRQAFKDAGKPGPEAERSSPDELCTPEGETL